MRSSGFLEKNTKGVRIEFEKKDSEVLLSDFDLWHHVLGYCSIDDNESDSLRFDNLLEANGINFTDRQNYTPEIRKVVEDSWAKIFDMNYCPEYAAHPFNKKTIQATCWSLSVKEIKKVDYFTAR